MRLHENRVKANYMRIGVSERCEEHNKRTSKNLNQKWKCNNPNRNPNCNNDSIHPKRFFPRERSINIIVWRSWIIRRERTSIQYNVFLRSRLQSREGNICPKRSFEFIWIVNYVIQNTYFPVISVGRNSREFAIFEGFCGYRRIIELEKCREIKRQFYLRIMRNDGMSDEEGNEFLQ